VTIETEDICSGPYEEPLAVIGDPMFSQRNLVECLTFAKQLHREFGEPPPGAELVRGGFDGAAPHRTDTRFLPIPHRHVFWVAPLPILTIFVMNSNEKLSHL